MTPAKETPPPAAPPPPEGTGAPIRTNRRVRMRKKEPGDTPARREKFHERSPVDDPGPEDVSAFDAQKRSPEETSWPASETELRDINTLAPYARNPRLHGEGQIDQLVASIKRWGFTIPLLADEAGELIAGHARLEAAKKLELKRVPVMTARGWTDAQKRAYVIADNRLAMNSSWDDGLLIDELSGLKLSDFDLAALGFTDAELADMIGAPDAEAFGPASADDQQRLDQKSPVTCPECGHVFNPS